MAAKTFSDMVQEEIVDTLMNTYKYNEKDAKKFAKKKTNGLEGEMWTAFDKSLEYIMEEIKNG